MYFNRTVCDLYIGTGAGKKLMEDISNAKRSVKIVSPFLSPYLIGKLIDLHYQGINVQLITTDSIEKFYGNGYKILRHLIRQDQTIDHEMVALRSKWKVRKQLMKLFFVISTIILCVMAIWMQDRMVLWGLFLILPILLWLKILTRKISDAKIYKYTYRSIFPFKVCTAPISYSHPYIHGKIYLIDNEIAYLGSMNFTANGTKNNYETRIRITDPRAVKEMNEEFDSLLNNDDLPDKDIAEWGRELYVELGN